MADLLSTTNQVSVTNGSGVLVGSTDATLSTPQDIHTGATPTFAGATFNGIVGIGAGGSVANLIFGVSIVC